MNDVRFNRLIKLLQIICVLMLLASVCVAVLACKCVHDYNAEITTPASCSTAGEVTYTCSKCGDSYKEAIAALGNHDLSSTYSYDDTAHWQNCNLCDYSTDKVTHKFESVVSSKASTCTEQGAVVKSCVCGKTQTETLPLAEHNYTIYQKQGDKHWLKCENCDLTTAEETHKYDIQGTIIPSTCAEQGSDTKICICGETQTEALPLAQHSYTKSVYNDDEHWFVCVTCNDENTNQTRTPHDLTVKTTAADCGKAGETVTTCKGCDYIATEIIPATNNHDYVTVTDSYVDATCKDYGTHVGICTVCGDTKTFVDEHLGYGDHNVKEYPTKEMTETEPGNRHYWQCTVCEKYFTSQSCVDELTADQVFFYPPTQVSVESVSQLIEIGQKLSINEISEDYYLIEGTVDGVISESNTLMISDSSGDPIWVTLIDRENVSTINEKDSIVLKGNLMRSSDDVILVECQVISVDCGDDELHSLFFTVVEDSPYINFYIYAYDEMGEYYDSNTNNYNCLLDGTKLIFNYYDINNNTVLQKVIINNKAYTATGGELEITVTEDIHAEFVFDHNNYCSVTIRELDTSNNNGNAIVADEYISYTYTNGGYNDDGRLHKNSHLTFTANNANITGINITYDATWLNNNPDVLNNIVNAIKANGNKVNVEQGSANGNSQIKISLSASDAYVALEYFANSSQARVVEIIVLYETYNTFYETND